MRVVLLSILLSLPACKPDPVPAPPIAPSAATTAAPTEPTPPPPPAAPMQGTPVAYAEPETLHQNGEFLVQRQSWAFDGATGKTWLVRVPRHSPVAVAHSPDVVAFDDLLPRDTGPWAAINGGFYEAHEDHYRPMGLVISDGKVENERTRRGGSGVFFVDADGPQIVHRKALKGAPTQALQSIDRLVDAGKSVVKARPDASPAMRSAVALSQDHLWLVALAGDGDIRETTDGAQLARTGVGLPLWAFAEYLIAATGASEALNLDGGVSTQLAVADADFTLRIRGVRGTINAVVVRADIASPPSKR